MKRLALVALLLLAACNATFTVSVPYCPVSDSAKARADSIPLGCNLPDSLVKR